MKKAKVKLEMTKDMPEAGLKKGDVIERTQSIARLHTHKLKNAKPYVKPKPKTKAKK